MAKVQSSVLHNEMEKLRSRFSCSKIEFFIVGSGIECPVHITVSPHRHGALNPDEAIEAGKALIEAGKAAKEFVYNGYFVDWGE